MNRTMATEMSEQNGKGGQQTVLLEALVAEFSQDSSHGVLGLLRFWIRCKKVGKILDVTTLEPQEVLDSYNELEEVHMKKIRHDFNAEVFREILATMRFVQFLFECPATPTTQVNKISIALLQNFKIAALSRIQNAQDQLDFASFALGSMIKAIAPLAGERPLLLSPLWKGICEICAAVKMRKLCLPFTLAKDCLAALYDSLHQGQTQLFESLNQTSQLHQQRLQYQVKVVAFMISRAAALLPTIACDEPVTRECKDELLAIFDVLFRLAGVAETISFSSPTLSKSLHESLDSKVARCILGALAQSWNENQSQALDPVILDLVLQTSRSEKSYSEKKFESNSIALGKLFLLQTLLQRTLREFDKKINGSERIPLILSICEEILFSTLPLCHEYITYPKHTSGGDLLGKILQTLAQTFMWCDACTQHRDKFQSLLIRWMAPQRALHPCTREVLLSLVDNHVRWLSRQSKIGSTGSVVACSTGAETYMVSLMAKLLMDKRTHFGHRQNIASVLLSLCKNTESTNDKLANSVKQLVARNLMIRLKPSERADMEKYSVPPVCYSYFDQRSPQDVLIITRVVEQLSLGSILPSFQDVYNVCSYIAGQSEDKVTVFPIVLVLSLLTGLVCGATPEHVKHHFQNQTKMQLNHFCITLMQFANLQFNGFKQRRALSDGELLIVSCSLRFLKATMQCLASEFQIDQTSQMEPLLMNVASLLSKLKATRTIATAQLNEKIVIFETISLLGEVGPCILSSGNNIISKAIPATFAAMFGTRDAAIVATTMTSFERFASSLDHSQTHLLRLCLSSTHDQSLFQCRLQGIVYTEDNKGSSLKTSHEHCSNALLNLVPDAEYRRASFPNISDFALAPGSLMLPMPTQEGRTALVVFPPGDESKEDIQFMLGQEWERKSTFTLQRIIPTRGGKGCRLAVMEGVR